uniref:Animal inward rectifier K channel (IRKC) family protein putative n=1 Tax=Albugo laibachii Nc14 TaxID=890382 RepID=F0WGM8_9STRA|nr:animal inward rectifier K channel (IRKC) family protein putative [Albugo laibachii Nc14]|eukprot:CCA20392.1 animal inward rectifier K channel (IRKC) family protein putative [Albugo laibachii Nc14]
MLEVKQPLLHKPTANHAPVSSRVRFVDRQGHFRQSLGRFNIKRIGGDWRKRYYDDPFHTVVNTSTSRIVIGIFALYTLIILLFAFAYLFVSRVESNCHVGLNTVMEAYIFSLETIMTIGYGAPTNDIFYGGCKTMAILLSLEAYAGIFLDSICIGMFFTRFARANKRANTIMFTNYGIIREIRGHYYFMCQTCERRKHQLVEAHVRLYAIHREFDERGICENMFQSHVMRIQQPDDDLGSTLLMALPQTIIHRIDPWSPLFPPECLPNEYCSMMAPAYPDPCQRLVDMENGSRDGFASEKTVPYQLPSRSQIEKHLKRSELEIVVILEGIDGSTSATMQARHSYIDSDIAWDSSFEPCVYRSNDGKIVIDFDKFHSIRPPNIKYEEDSIL